MLVNVSLGSLLPSSFQRELSAQRRRVQQLEAYLGGELPSEGSGLTWREERSTLTTRIRVGGWVKGRRHKWPNLIPRLSPRPDEK